ncbi:hypothetical protein [Methylopila sp. M107]|uniref:hypothetical protein n=1 Tax=Methylopila sp. M107 TaxID=1101190 RepID=UPI00035C7A8E|nr:hypothetical protein [Methylopila sp. M107]
MMILPPSQGPGRAERRAGDRRVADRARKAKAADASAPEADGIFAAGPDDGGEQGSEASGGPAFRARGRGPGRRRTDRDQSGATANRSAGKPHAPLVAQLIATALNLEQTRTKRRGSEQDAAALYARKAERVKPSRGEA